MIWIDPAVIRFKISPSAGLEGDVGGDWDTQCRIRLTDTVKYRAVWQHFSEGVRWQDTDLFRDLYARRLAEGGRIRGASTIDDLASCYIAQIDPLFVAMRRDGFKVVDRLPRLLQGGDGELFIGNQGNHRLAIAHVLGLKSFAGEIVCRHP